MQFRKVFLFCCSLAAIALTMALAPSGSAQQRDRDRDRGRQGVVDDDERQQERGRAPRGERDRPAERNGRGERDRRGQRDHGEGGRQAAPAPQRRQAGPAARQGRAAPAQRRRFERRAERRWHRGGHAIRGDIYIPGRWAYRARPHHRALWNRRYGRVWWCGVHCRIGLLFGFSVWSTRTVVSYDSSYSFPIWESLEYNRTGEPSLWESGWGYVEFTPTRTFARHFRGYSRDCRDFTRVVVRSDGFERRFRGTACRNPNGSWWIVSSARVF